MEQLSLDAVDIMPYHRLQAECKRRGLPAKAYVCFCPHMSYLPASCTARTHRCIVLEGQLMFRKSNILRSSLKQYFQDQVTTKPSGQAMQIADKQCPVVLHHDASALGSRESASDKVRSCIGIAHTVDNTKIRQLSFLFLFSQQDDLQNTSLPSHEQNGHANKQLLGLDSTADNLQSPLIPQHGRQSLLATAGATPLPGQKSNTKAVSSEQSLSGACVDNAAEADDQDCQEPRACLVSDKSPRADETQVSASL